MTERLTVGLVSLTSGVTVAHNVDWANALIGEAAAAGAEFVCLPEVSNLMQRRRTEAMKVAATEAADPALAAWREEAIRHGIWLHIGSLVIRLEDDERFANRGFLIDPTGEIRARYDKIHMFDVNLDGGESFRESAGFRPGERAVLAVTPWGGYGMTICYDLRFAHLYRMLAQAGAGILSVPSAFTRQTGQAHWHSLLRARAIENGCFVLAAAQCGDHEDGRRTYGHSLVVDPWGEVLADGGEAPGVVVAELDLARISEARRKIPALNHDRPIEPPAVPM